MCANRLLRRKGIPHGIRLDPLTRESGRILSSRSRSPTAKVSGAERIVSPGLGRDPEPSGKSDAPGRVSRIDAERLKGVQMAWRIMVQLKNGKTDIYSPDFATREEAERDLATIRARLGHAAAPEVSWMASKGSDILGAHVMDVGNE